MKPKLFQRNSQKDWGFRKGSWISRAWGPTNQGAYPPSSMEMDGPFVWLLWHDLNSGFPISSIYVRLIRDRHVFLYNFLNRFCGKILVRVKSFFDNGSRCHPFFCSELLFKLWQKVDLGMLLTVFLVIFVLTYHANCLKPLCQVPNSPYPYPKFWQNLYSLMNCMSSGMTLIVFALWCCFRSRITSSFRFIQIFLCPPPLSVMHMLRNFLGGRKPLPWKNLSMVLASLHTFFIVFCYVICIRYF